MHIFFIHRKALLFLLLCVVFGLILLIDTGFRQVATQVYHYVYPKTSIYCYRIEGGSLPDISEVKPRKGKSIFFHETSCNSYLNGKITIGIRQACAVESAAKMNPNFDIYLLYASPGQFCFEDDTQSDRMLKVLLTYPNVNILHFNVDKYTRGTPVEDLYKKGLIENSEYAMSHASDVLRYLTLWKYGGIYLDLDVIVIKSLEDLPLNYAGAESEMNIAAGILSFAPTGIGHHFARSCLNDLKDHFNGYDWGYNGPGVITRFLKNLCDTVNVKDMLGKDCEGFTVYPTEKFYAIPWWNWTMYFDESHKNAVLNASKDSYIVHVWNKHSESKKLPLSSEIPYVLYAKQHCPKIIQECHEYF